MTNSAMGERQMLPWQTNSIFFISNAPVCMLFLPKVYRKRAWIATAARSLPLSFRIENARM